MFSNLFCFWGGVVIVVCLMVLNEPHFYFIFIRHILNYTEYNL